jgi:hypothetical protein
MVILAHSTNQIIGLWYQLMLTEITQEWQQAQKYKILPKRISTTKTLIRIFVTWYFLLSKLNIKALLGCLYTRKNVLNNAGKIIKDF